MSNISKNSAAWFEQNGEKDALAMDKVNEIVLESAVVILSGGADKDRTPLITFPVDSADMVDIYPAGDILRLMQAFADLCSGHVAVVADLTDDWTEECIEKLVHLLDDLQITRRGCVKTVYVVEPSAKTKKMKLLCVRNKREVIRRYDIKGVRNLEEIYQYIERSQLTVDYGGTMQYNHIAWVDFQRTYVPVILAAKEATEKLQTIKEEIARLRGRDTDDFEICHDRQMQHYQSLLCQHKIRDTIANCQDAIEKLEHPECDPNLIQTHSAVLEDTLNQLKAVHQSLTTDLSDIDAIMNRTDGEHAVFLKLKECSDNTKEVEETIDLMMQQVQNLPLVGTNAEEVQRYRNNFTESILLPSQDIVSCATSILQDLDCGKDISQNSYTLALEIAKRITDSLEPFTQHLNEFNEVYIRIHLFHVLCDKTERWKEKATHFLKTGLCYKSYAQSTEKLQAKSDRTCYVHICPEVNCTRKGKQTSELSINLDHLKHHKEVSRICRIAAPGNWETLLQRFYKKHPPPKKKHIKLLNKFVPKCISEKQRHKAEVLAERVLFILQMLTCTVFKVDDILLIQTWSCQNIVKNQSTQSADVSLV